MSNVKHSKARAHPRASTTARKPWGSLRFHSCFLGMRNNHQGKQLPSSTRGRRPAPVWGWPQCSASPEGPQPAPVSATTVGLTCGRAWGSELSFGGGPGGSLGRGSVLGAAPGGDSQPPSFFSSVLMVQFTMLPTASSSRWGETGLLMDILRGSRAVSTATGHPPATGTQYPMPSASGFSGAMVLLFATAERSQALVPGFLSSGYSTLGTQWPGALRGTSPSHFGLCREWSIKAKP